MNREKNIFVDRQYGDDNFGYTLSNKLEYLKEIPLSKTHNNFSNKNMLIFKDKSANRTLLIFKEVEKESTFIVYDIETDKIFRKIEDQSTMFIRFKKWNFL